MVTEFSSNTFLNLSMQRFWLLTSKFSSLAIEKLKIWNWKFNFVMKMGFCSRHFRQCLFNSLLRYWKWIWLSLWGLNGFYFCYFYINGVKRGFKSGYHWFYWHHSRAFRDMIVCFIKQEYNSSNLCASILNQYLHNFHRLRIAWLLFSCKVYAAQ